MPIRQILDLAGNAPIGAGITIDFEASRDLGNELIVVRVPEPRHDLAGAPMLANLSREQEVAMLIAAGLSNKLIADRLCIATSTAKDHVHHILQKTGLPNRPAIAAVKPRLSSSFEPGTSGSVPGGDGEHNPSLDGFPCVTPVGT